MLNPTGPQIAGILMLVIVIPVVYLVERFRGVRGQTSVLWFFLSVVSGGIWVLVLGITPLVPSEEVSRFLLYRVRTFGMASSVFIFLFVLEYSVGRTLPRTAVLVVMVVPAVTVGVLWTRPEMFMDVQLTSGGFYELSLDRIGFVHVGYIMLLHVMSITLLLRERLITEGMKRKQVTVLLGGYVLGVVPVFLPIFGAIPNYFNPGALGLVSFMGIAAYSLDRFGLFVSSPMDKEAVFREIDDAVVILGTGDRIIDVNRAAEELFGIEGRYAGKTARETFADHPEVRDLLEGRETTDTLSISTDGGERYFSPIVSSIGYGRGLSGKIMVLRDVTAVKDRERELDMLRKIFSRVFRHNIRNELNVARGHLETIQTRTEDEVIANRAATANRSTERLLSYAEKAREIENAIDTPDETRFRSLPDLVSTAVAGYEDVNSGATVVESVDDVTVAVIDDFGEAIRNAVENAIGHNPSPVTVEVWTETTEEFVTVNIEDDGEGIPEAETDPLTNEEETAMSHGSGVGLWLIKWYVEKSDGELRVENTGNGTCVSMRLRRGS
ncbi:MAG: ATP-binding protein [Halobacteriales archaeon]